MIRAGVALLLLALTGLVVWSWSALDRPIARVHVAGQLNAAEQQQVRETLQQNVAGGLLSVDLNELSARLEELSWPRQVKIRRVWPDKLNVELEKALVVAGWNGGYLTMDGEIVEMAGDMDELVQFQCHHAEPQAALDLYQRLQRQAGRAELQISRLEENELGEWRLIFSNGVALNLGASELSDRLQRFIAVFQSDLSNRLDQIAAVDARYASGVAVSWRAGAEDNLTGSTGPDLSMGLAGNQTRAEHGFR